MSLMSLPFFNRGSADKDPADSEQDRAESSKGAQNGNGAAPSEEPVESDTSLAVRRLKDMLEDENETAEEELGGSETDAVDELEHTEIPADAVSIAAQETTPTSQDDDQAPGSASGRSTEQSSEAESEPSSEAEQDDASAHESDLSELRSRADQAEQKLAQLQQEVSDEIEEARRQAEIAHAAQVTEIETRAAEQLEATVRDAQTSAQAELSHALKRFPNRPCTTWGGCGISARTDAGGPMRASSMDLRERVLLDSDAGMKAADVAAKYRVSGSWVRLLKQRRRETGEVAPRVQRHGRRPMLEPHLHTLAALIAE